MPSNTFYKTVLFSTLCSMSLLGCFTNTPSSNLQPIIANTQNHLSSPQDVEIAGAYKKHQIKRADEDSASNIVVHIEKLGLLKPTKNISFKVTTTNISDLNQPACHYNGTATLMGQDALHGIVYTIPVESFKYSADHNHASMMSIAHVINGSAQSAMQPPQDFTLLPVSNSLNKTDFSHSALAFDDQTLSLTPIASTTLESPNNHSQSVALSSGPKDISKGLIFLRFKDNVLSIDSNNPDSLTSVCTGNISLKGHYASTDQ